MRGIDRALGSIGAASAGILGAFKKAAKAEAAPGRALPVYTGLVDAASAERFLDVIGENTDQVLGLKLVVQPPEESDRRYFVHLTDEQLIISSGDPLGGLREVLVNGPIGRTWDMYAIDGFYLVKFGGMHAAGAQSWGAIPVDEAAIRMKSNVHIVERSL